MLAHGCPACVSEVSIAVMDDVSGKSLAEMSADELKAWFDQRFVEKMREQEASRTPRLSIMVTTRNSGLGLPSIYHRIDRRGHGMGCLAHFYIL